MLELLEQERIQVADDGLRHRLINACGNLGRTGSEQEPGRGRESRHDERVYRVDVNAWREAGVVVPNDVSSRKPLANATRRHKEPFARLPAALRRSRSSTTEVFSESRKEIDISPGPAI